MEKRPYYNQAQKLCPQCGEWKIHTRGRKYYTCLTCGLRTLKAQANKSVQRTVDKSCAVCGTWMMDGINCNECGHTHRR